MKKIFLSALVVSGSLLPLFAHAQAYQYQRQGIFDCNQNGAFAMNVGSLTASGIYVPVADATVELNTGILVYKECVLREVVDRMRESASVSYYQKAYKGIQEGRNKNPLYVVNEGQELLTSVGNPAFVAWYQGPTLNSLNPAFKALVTHAVVVNYDTTVNAPESALACPYQGDLSAFQTKPTQSFSWDAFFASANPSCVPFYAAQRAQDLASARVAAAKQYQLDQWNWGRGYYARTDGAADPLAQRVLTPASNVNSTFQNIIDSPVRQLESANDIGQMIGAVYAGVATQIIADTQGQGLAGLSQSFGGTDSYLKQMSDESGQGLREVVANVGNLSLTGDLDVENQYNQILKSIASLLTQAITQLRGAENQCWALVVPKVRQNASQGGFTLDESKIQAATSSQEFSQALVDSQIKGLSDQILPEIQKSDAMLAQLKDIGTRLANSATQQRAIQELDQLNSFYATRRSQLTSLVRRQQDTQGALSKLVQNAINNWTGIGPDESNPLPPPGLPWDGTKNPGVGWCNVNNTDTITAWTTKWKK